MQNRAAIMYGTHDIRLEERPIPEPGPKEVLVEIRAVGVCGSDVHYYEEGRIGSFVVDEPLVLGHESMGTVVGLGEGATKHEIGERVALEPGSTTRCGRPRAAGDRTQRTETSGSRRNGSRSPKLRAPKPTVAASNSSSA